MNPPALPRLQAHLQALYASEVPIRIEGLGSKSFLTPDLIGEPLSLAPLRGVIAYEPSELVISVWAGTPIAEVTALLAEHGQGLLFEPPLFNGSGSIGGLLAAGLAGPARAYRGGVRDYVLGVKLLRHDGEVMNFGGTVMKNVAGFDVSRQWVGSMGRCGPLIAASLKVFPLPRRTVSLRLAQTQAESLQWVERLSTQPIPITASAWFEGFTTIRLAGSASVVDSAVRALDADATVLDEAQSAAWWAGLTHHTHPFLADTTALWRVSVPLGTGVISDEPTLVEWGGALRTLRAAHVDEDCRARIAAAGGYVTPWPCDLSAQTQLLDPTVQRLTDGIRRVYDPKLLYNRTR